MEKIRQRRSILPAAPGPAPIPFQRFGGDSPSTKNRVGLLTPLGELGGPRGAGLGAAAEGAAGRSAAALPPAGLRRRESLEEEPRAALAQRIEKETVGLARGAPGTPGPSTSPPTTPSPGPGAKRQQVGVSAAGRAA